MINNSKKHIDLQTKQFVLTKVLKKSLHILEDCACGVQVGGIKKYN